LCTIGIFFSVSIKRFLKHVCINIRVEVKLSGIFSYFLSHLKLLIFKSGGNIIFLYLYNNFSIYNLLKSLGWHTEAKFLKLFLFFHEKKIFFKEAKNLIFFSSPKIFANFQFWHKNYFDASVCTNGIDAEFSKLMLRYKLCTNTQVMH